ncbi:pannexin-2-like [Coturnix japonica]|uniref:pannexin-2-like n=1 Tax=Coturnix japonica TaxID=93934 RepID=UPI000777C1C9|nr:pannexin-2-like [Coturnix japonica]
MQHIIDNHPDMATALLAGEKLKELILPGQQDDKAGALAALLLQLKLELPFDRVVTIGTVLIPILLVTLVFTKNFAGKGGGAGRGGRALTAVKSGLVRGAAARYGHLVPCCVAVSEVSSVMVVGF